MDDKDEKGYKTGSAGWKPYSYLNEPHQVVSGRAKVISVPWCMLDGY